MEKTNQGKVVVVTGASAGVGRAVVAEFARQGAHIGLIARGKDRLEATRREVEELGGKALVLPTDVADAQQVEEAAERVEKELGPIDIWVNDAMTTIFAPFLEITPAEFKRATEVTYLGQVYGTMAALKRMHARNRGTIVQVGSALAYRSIPLQSPYCGAKHAIAGFTDSIRSELIHDKSAVHITAVMLPAMNTPQFSWCRTRLPRHPQPVPPSFSPKWPRAPLSGRPRTSGGKFTSASPPSRRSTVTSSRRLSRTGILRKTATMASRLPSPSPPIAPTISSNPSKAITTPTEFLATEPKTSACRVR